LGIAWEEPDRWGNRSITGMPAEVVRAFSKRSQQISQRLSELEERGRQRTPALIRFAVQASRKAKQHEDPESLHARWRSEARALDVDPERLVDQVSGRSCDTWIDEQAVAQAFDRLAGAEGLTAQASTFARQDVVVALGGELATVTADELQALTNRFLSERAVPLIDDRAEPGTERRWSTPDLLTVERTLVAAAQARQTEQTAVVPSELVRATLAAHPTIGEDQAGMVRRIAVSPGRRQPYMPKLCVLLKARLLAVP
jgi:hypothetical protein